MKWYHDVLQTRFWGFKSLPRCQILISNSMLRIYNDSTDTTVSDFKDITCKLDEIGVLYKNTFSTSTTLDTIDYIKYEYSVPYYDVVFLNNKTINYNKIRKEFIREHTHTDFEMRFITHGTATFYIKDSSTIYEITVNTGDLISIPANMKHWFDAGETPDLSAIRFFTDTNGWIANYT